MSVTWYGADPAPHRAPRTRDRARGALRGGLLVSTTVICAPVVLLLNMLEPATGRDWGHRLVRLWARICLALCGVRLRRVGRPMPHPGAVVANHAGWLDIFTLLSADGVHFVSKAEVRGWPVVGPLSRLVRPVYIERRRSASKTVERQLAARLAAGHRLCFFPEGTSTDGRRVLAFRSTVFAAFEAAELRRRAWVQPASVVYHPPAGLPDSFYGWWGDMGLAPHLWAVLCLSAGGEVEVVHHAALRVADFPDRKALARAAEEVVRGGVTARLD